MVSGLPKETIDFRLSEEERFCPECGEKLTEVRKTIRRELIVIPAQVKVKEYINAVYACRNCQKNGNENPMHTGRSPKPFLDNSLASASFVSDIMKKKFRDGIIYSQNREASVQQQCSGKEHQAGCDLKEEFPVLQNTFRSKSNCNRF